MQPTRRTVSASPFALIGVAIGIAAVILALFQGQVRAVVAPPPPPPATAKHVAVELGRALLEAKGAAKASTSKSTPPTAPETQLGPTDPVTVGYMGLGVLALLFGVVGFVRRENQRVVGAAIAFGIIGAAWTYVIAAMLLAVVIVVAAAVFT